VEPTTTTPWRTIEAPTEPPPADAMPGPTSRRATTRIVAAGCAAIACGALALALAVGGGGGGVVVEASAGAGLSFEPGMSAPPVAANHAGTEVVVEIVGAVANPGLFRLPAGSRVGDLVSAAGGYGPRVDTAWAERDLNLAATLRDGDHLHVPSRDDPAPSTPSGRVAPNAAAGAGAGTGAPIDLNTATAAELEALPGIGPATSAKILAARDEAPFSLVDDLRTRGLVGQKVFEKIRELVTVG
jgi:competence protein ComEA